MVQLCGYVDPLILVTKCLGGGWNEPKGRRPLSPGDQVNTHTNHTLWDERTVQKAIIAGKESLNKNDEQEIE